MRVHHRARRGQLGALSCFGGDPTIETRGRLEDHKRPPLPCRREERLVQANRGVIADTGLHFDAVGAQHRKPASADKRKWIFHRSDDATDAGGDDPFRTRPRLAGVDARLERAVERGAARIAPRLFERVHLGVRFTGALVCTLTEHDPFIRHDARPNDWIRRRAAEAAARVLERPPHPPFVVYHFS